jgi:Rrf2 family transcriptional regulator, nitric oxide-sensitive transcriptional repressor
MTHMASRAPESQTSREVSVAAHVPEGYMAKVMQGLARAGLIVSQRGVGGGFTLAREPSAISIYDVVQSVDSLERITHCPLGLPEHHPNLCPLHRRLDEAIGLVEKSFRETSLADLL